MRRWGLSIPPDCVLCSGNAESREHLFFSCGFSSAVWGHFLARNSLSPPLLFMDCFTWVSSPSRDPNISLIIKLVFQASIYLLWKERNRRLHDLTARSSTAILKEIKVILRAKLDPLSRSSEFEAPAKSLLSTWFRFFN
ncbi:putative reverse transcriptase zinc-binding domain-containing protein [Arabidopsis thaliana]